jgi:FKBP-type peptidyl-prolyl cis-trans isomerase 2
MRTRFFLFALCACALLAASAVSAKPELRVSKMPYGGETEPEPIKERLAIEDGFRVSLEYALSLDGGDVIDSNLAGGDPLVYTQGGGQLLPALERALAGMRGGERKKIAIPPEDAFGSVKPELVQEVDAKLIPVEARTPGFELVSTNPQGQRQMVKVREVKGDRVVLDYNHPLAGETLHYDVRVIGIKDPNAPPE